jgi:hypothetical protein
MLVVRELLAHANVESGESLVGKVAVTIGAWQACRSAILMEELGFSVGKICT